MYTCINRGPKIQEGQHQNDFFFPFPLCRNRVCSKYAQNKLVRLVENRSGSVGFFVVKC